MIEIQNLSRYFGQIKAVDDISFTVENGSITGFLGPNGAGKTTTMRMMVGYLQPSGGSIMLDQQSIYKDPILTSTKIGYLPEHNPLYDEMYTLEILKYIGDLRKMGKTRFKERLDFVVQSCGLKAVLTQKVATLSKGYRQRVGLAMAILHDPEVLILDEPTSGLDPNQILDIRELIRNLGKEKIVLLSSHIMQEVQALCDRVLIINKGKIIVDDEIENLGKYLTDYQTLNLELEGEDVDIEALLSDIQGLKVEENLQENNRHKIRLSVPGDKDLKHEIARRVTAKGWLIVSLYSQSKSLEEIFHNLTKSDGQGKPAESETDQVQDLHSDIAVLDSESDAKSTQADEPTQISLDNPPAEDQDEKEKS
nr:gliding motility-associated transport system ATP-binding protein [Candidatus Cloacimonadota bacterium]